MSKKKENSKDIGNDKRSNVLDGSFIKPFDAGANSKEDDFDDDLEMSEEEMADFMKMLSENKEIFKPLFEIVEEMMAEGMSLEEIQDTFESVAKGMDDGDFEDDDDCDDEEDYDDYEDSEDYEDSDVGFGISEEYESQRSDKNSNYTMVLKIQMRGVKKPPMWRMVEVPANYTYLDLHRIIQTVTGLDDEHLWMFQREIYGKDLVIGLPVRADGYGVDDWTDDASKTPITAFLHKAGDRIYYIYDFRHDWIFTVSVDSIQSRHIDAVKCVDFKSDMQCDENYLPHMYETLRNIYEQYEDMTDEQLKKMADDLFYDDVDDMLASISDKEFDLDFVNEELEEI